MAAAVIGALRVTLGLDTAAFQEGLGIVQKRMAATGAKLQETGAKIAVAGVGISAAITAPITALVKASVPAAVESQQALAQVTAALASMGPVAGRTAEQLQEQAGALQSISNFDDDDILKSVTANLLTFGNVTGEQFDRAQLAAVNLSARLGQDLQSSAIQLGKALNDPVKGVNALQRVGVSFTAQQKEQIAAMVEAGDTAGAQSIILGELEKQFAGAAKAQRDATPDAAMQEQWRTLQENIGAVALKVLPPLLNVLTTLASGFNNLSPPVQTFIVGAAAVAAALGPITIGVGGMITAFGAVLPALAPVATFLTATLIPAAVATAPVWGPIALAIGGVGLAIAAFIKWRPQIEAFVAAVVDRMRAMYEGVKTWLADKLSAVFEAVKQKVKAVGDAFYTLWDRVVGHSYIPDMVDAIGDHIGRLQGNMVDAAESATTSTAQHFADMAQNVVDSIDGIIGRLSSGDWKGAIESALGALQQFGIFGKGGGWAGTSVDINAGTESSLGSVFAPIPAFATGGSFAVQGMRGIDRNLLQLNGQPIARVSHGEMVNVGRGSGPSVNQTINVAGGVDLATRTEVIRLAAATKQAALSAMGDQARRRG